MKKQYVELLQEGDTVGDYFVAVRKDLREQQSGAKFLGTVFKDRTGEIGGILWQNAVAVSRLFEVGDVVNVRGTVASYQDRLQIRIDQVLPLRMGEYDPADLVYTPPDSQKTLGEFLALLDTVKNEWLRSLLARFTADAQFMTRFAASAAAKKWHHAYRGGLVQHCLEVGRLAAGLCDVFPNLDRDLLLTSVFVHDIGKLDEMTHELFVDYTNSGKLLCHLAIGTDLVQTHIDAIEGFPETLRLQLLHCILSHHGTLENGSPVVPKTLEALALHHLDNMDAQLEAFTRIIAETREKRQAWSEYIPLIDRQVWTKDE